MTDYLFDLKCFITIRVEAKDEAEAREKLFEQIHNYGWTAEGTPVLVEVDDRAV